MEKIERINKTVDEAGKVLSDIGVKYLIGAIDRQPDTKDGGKVFIQADITGEDLRTLISAVLKTRQDVVELGIWIGQMLTNKIEKK